MRSALDVLVARHDTLRSVYRLDGDRVVQELTPAALNRLEVVDLRSCSDPAGEALARASENAQRVFDLESGPVLRTVLYQIGDEDHLLLLCLHHIAGDAWSFGIIGRELSVLYNAHVAGDTAVLPPLPIEYRDYACWQREWLSGTTLEPQLEFWRHKLSGVEPIDLPTDRPRPAVLSLRGAQHLHKVSSNLLLRLRLYRGPRRSHRFLRSDRRACGAAAALVRSG